ncbi:threonine-phosphate decarboxylase CobD [Clostridium sp. LIBA-8841]|uniref:threonine-phosphate decarboxylase CobD n=1 Tax=Clostridium sp. LIBA-8841 TaxID=2987530 RepID=UPI002AC57F6E|nr:threonine-phosphate decarboxylase CobD [Clostridium sp. LIBA-8841]MDZ5253347.1 threonine-phosphate decarboxylase CobD [Clostridium sp. LIBA-8841]
MNLGHGGNVEEIKRIYGLEENEIIDFSANINPMGISEKVKEAMIRGINSIERYPDITYYKLKKEISSFEKVDLDKIVLGNGAAEVIFNIVRGIKPKNALIIAPTFSEYEDALNSLECKVNHYILKDRYSLDNRFIDEINDDLDIIFLCNPNNPTGALIEKDFSLRVLKKAKEMDVKVVFDESFLDFVEDNEKYSVIEYLDDFNNLIVVKSLTKLFAFPGIRLGYGLSSDFEMIKKINSVATPWSVNTVADYAGREALKEVKYIKDSIAYVKKENEFLYNGLKAFKDINVFKGAVNFLFFKLSRELNLREELIKQGIIIRSCNNYIGLDNSYYRVAVRRREENEKLLEALSKILK